MKLAFLLLSSVIWASPVSAAETNTRRKPCECKCMVKEEDGKYGSREASGVDREAAGEALKKKLGRLKCEVTPACTGGCNLD